MTDRECTNVGGGLRPGSLAAAVIAFLRAARTFLRDGDEHAFTARTCAHSTFDLERMSCCDCYSTAEYLYGLGVSS